jgi:hypothetical protein
VPGGSQSATSGDVGFRDFSFGTTGNSAPTGEKPECKLWWNDGSWWGDLYNDAAGDNHIYRLDLSTQTWVDTGTLLDPRVSKADVLWDQAAQKLYVASHIFTTNALPTVNNWGRLFRYSYSHASGYSLDAGFPVDITRGNAEDLAITKDSVGRLWATWVESAGDDQPPLASDDQVPSVLPVSPDGLHRHLGHRRVRRQPVGVMWSNRSRTRRTSRCARDTDPASCGAQEIVAPDRVPASARTTT